MVTDVTFAEQFEFLLFPMRNKGAYGGRGSAKSWQFAEALLWLAGGSHPLTEELLPPKRVVCGRETQRSIADSVHALLGDLIKRVPAWEAFYTVKNTEIVGKNGSEFLFHGLQHNPAAIKSLEGADICWIEEAQSVGAESFEMLIPTIRKPGSEIWASWNPRLESDPVHQRFVISPAPNTICKRVSYRDNPWFPQELQIEMEHLKATDYQAYLHVWEGECKGAAEGAVYADELSHAQATGRITQVMLDRRQLVETFWDLGYGDSTAIWFAQALPTGQIRIVDYLESKGKPIEWYVLQLNQIGQDRGYIYGNDWLPHDGVDAIIHHRLSGDRSQSPEQRLRALGRKVRVAPKLNISVGIGAVRTIFPSLWFDNDRCIEGLDHLRLYQWGPRRQSRAGGSSYLEEREPIHDQSSHAADALRTLAMAIKTPRAEAKPIKRQEIEPEPLPGPYAPFG